MVMIFWQRRVDKSQLVAIPALLNSSLHIATKPQYQPVEKKEKKGAQGEGEGEGGVLITVNVYITEKSTDCAEVTSQKNMSTPAAMTIYVVLP